MIVLVAAVGIFTYTKISEHYGEKLWELSDPVQFSYFLTSRNSDTVLLVSADGNIQTIDGQTGRQKWKVTMPEEKGFLRPLMIDNKRWLICQKDRIWLCSSDRSTPVWELSISRSILNAKLIAKDDSLYIANSPTYSYFDMPSELEHTAEALLESLYAMESAEFGDEKERTSSIMAVDILSGTEKWQTELEEINISGLLADEERVYAAGYSPQSYRVSSFAKRQDPTKDDGPEDTTDRESSGKTQLWALNAGTGKPEWKLDGTGSFLVPPAMSKEGIIFSTKKNIYLLTTGGEIKWTYSFSGRDIYSLQTYEDRLLACTNDGFLLCLELSTGNKMWLTDIGGATSRIIASYPLVCVAGFVETGKSPQQVIPTKRWEGSEDLLQKALKSPEVKMEPMICGIDFDNGEQRWSILKREGEFELAGGILYILSHSERLQFMDASSDPSEIAKTVSALGAYDYLTGDRIWEQGIDGRATNLCLAKGFALVISRPEVLSLAIGGGGRVPSRLMAISLE